MRSFDDYLRIGLTRKGSKDPERAKSLVAESERKLRSMREFREKVGLKESNANDFIISCYDSLMELVRAKMYLEGFATTGKGAHEVEVSFLFNLGFNDADVRFMDKLRQFRNGINYDGSSFDSDYAKMVISFTERIHPLLRKTISN